MFRYKHDVGPNPVDDTFDDDWLTRSRVGVLNGIRYFAVPTWLAYSICDYIYAPKKIILLLALRFAFVPLTLAHAIYVASSETKKSFLRRYSGLVASYGLIVLLFIAIVKDPHNIYFTGDFAVAAGAYTFVTVTETYLFVLAAYIFVPFFVYALAVGMAVNYTYHFVVFLFVSIGMVVIFEHARRHLSAVHLQEFHARRALQQILTDKEKTIQKLVDNVRLLNIHSGASSQDDAAKVARQVAHDIRSPISAMNAIAKKVEDISPDLANMLKMSSKRINDIADSLSAPAGRVADMSTLTTDVESAIRSVVKEKQLKINSNTVQIKTTFDFGLPRLPIPASNFERLISNLIENSIEAVGDCGVIEIRAAHKGSKVCIEIKDNGCGIPPEVLSKIGQYGFTHGKASGSGLGLAHAHEVITAAGGKIAVTSEQGKFTLVVIEVPAIG